METKKSAKRLSLPFYIVRRQNFSKRNYWLLRIGGVLLAFLVAGIVCTILKPGSFGTFFIELGRGTFDFTDISTIVDLLVRFSILLLISLALTPAFRMKLWNIGAEGQVLIGCLAAAGIAKFSPSTLPNIVIILLCLVGAIGASVVWCLIPAFFKAMFNTNETLFTLMLNYVAMIAVTMSISLWIKSGSMSFGVLSQGTFPRILGSTGFLVIPFAVALFIGMYFYLNKSKHGYEISVLGESANTARYVGINPKKVTIRTMALCGVLFGVIAFFIVCGVSRSLSESIVGGKGFTGVLVAWLGHFQPFEIALFAFLSAIMEQGTSTAASAVNISATQFSAICTGAFFFIIIACEFFSNYRIRVHHQKKKEVESL